jgi:hypothetical protein
MKHTRPHPATAPDSNAPRLLDDAQIARATGGGTYQRPEIVAFTLPLYQKPV